MLMPVIAYVKPFLNFANMASRTAGQEELGN
jgi:hypothetical protein